VLFVPHLLDSSIDILIKSLVRYSTSFGRRLKKMAGLQATDGIQPFRIRTYTVGQNYGIADGGESLDARVIFGLSQ
jgi:hypothetical protein